MFRRRNNNNNKNNSDTWNSKIRNEITENVLLMFNSH